ncbi:bifunctional riboflavin kinase/FAD synthetase [Cohnella pontilimi]|uniref:Riboflavin biosynthesis protein n=1 Tax=Cohnella pontilimi TaxID=2564100 RepID=A0A4U0FDY2_9BACL|nr:bifunctional riboflavin kinase/FAD synthetase [Cohnella pontilimi]TJY43143.1 bifunctional riboflavin kinase/FAD synthetase [Cohnella pontilimi]
MERYELTVDTIGNEAALPEGARKPQGLSLAIGFFDGVHLGHADVVRRAVAAARERGQTPAVMTFDPHPRAVLGQGDQYQTVLTPLDDKLALMASLGVEAAYVIKFDRDFAAVTAERFVQELLLPLGVRSAVVGFDFAFGHRGQGNAEALRLFSQGSIDVSVAEPVYDGGEKVSTTRIREALADGDCDTAARLLDRPYDLQGKVVHGDARGRQIGYPTANLFPEQPYVIPKPGVYAVTVSLLQDDGQPEPKKEAVVNIGFRPTFEVPRGELRLEAHLFDFEGDLYGRSLRLTFHSYIREEQKFASLEQLISQIGRDADQARTLLSRLRD